MTLVLAARDERYRITRSTSCQQVTLKLISDLPLSPYGTTPTQKWTLETLQTEEMIQAIPFSASVSTDGGMMSPDRFAAALLSQAEP